LKGIPPNTSMNRLYEELFENEERGTRKFEDDAAQDGVSSARAAMLGY
jgi:hypothetical protein